MDAFRHESKIVANANKDEFILPPSVYPPRWDERHNVESQIIQSAMRHADTSLVRVRTTKTKTEFISTLVCRRGICYRNNTGKENNHTRNLQSHHYKEGVKIDTIVNKSTSSRGPQGKAEPRRTKTNRPDSESICSFHIQLRLKEGKYWYMKYDTLDRGEHNHIRIPFEEQHRRMSTHTEEERRQAALFSQLTPSSSAQALTGSLTGTLPPTRHQLYHNQYTQEGSQQKLSQAQELILYLKQEVSNRKKRYVALFHEVSETSLLAISKYDLKRIANSLQQETPLNDPLMVSLETPDENGMITATNVAVNNEQDKVGLGEALHSIRKNLQVGKKVLLAVAWSREDERTLFSKFPEVMMIDVTMGTNSQGLPEAVICCPGPDMKIYTPVRAFLPSQCKWVFGWIWGTAIPILLGKNNLRRTQLVLSDGDCKIYNAFEEHRSQTYPSAVHGLCIFHLVTKPITDAGYKLRNRENALVQDQIATFKHWVFTWMKIGGVECEEEFQTSHGMLIKWLSSFRLEGNSLRNFGRAHDSLDHNSRELEKMLLTIMNHKAKWFFPSRKHLLHLQQKTTSALEGVFSTTKSLPGKKVTPNMTLLNSVRTQDLQVSNQMNELQRQWQIDVDSTPLWTNTKSALELTTMAESLKQAIMLQSTYYYVRFKDSEGTIELIRKEQNGVFCHECNNTQTDFCGTCFSQSPIPKWRRVRTISFAKCSDDLHAVHCSCLHNDGYPCRHIAAITEILPGHFIPRYHKKYISYFGEPGYEVLSQYYQPRLKDRRFLVSNSERDRIIEKARDNCCLFPMNFWNIPKVQCLQRTNRGMIPHQLIDLREEASPNKFQPTFSQGELSQEIGDATDRHRQEPQSPFVPMTGSFFHDSMAMIQMLSSYASRNARVRDEISAVLRKAYLDSMQIAQQNFPMNDQSHSEYLDLYPESDKRKKDVRIRAAGEPRKQSEKKKKKSDVNADNCTFNLNM